MKKSTEMIAPLLVVLLLAGTAVWIFYNYSGDYFVYKKFSSEGIKAEAVLMQKGIIEDGELHMQSITSPSDYHRFTVGYTTQTGSSVKCKLRVSKNTFDVISRRDELSVIYLASSPGRCTLPDALEMNQYLSLSLLGVAVFLLLLAAGFLYYIYTSFRLPPAGELTALSTAMELPRDMLLCPKCTQEMTEGYMPTVGGVSWRDRGDPVGIPTMLSGLPGTTHWVRRPLLHAYHCKKCNIITFRYGGTIPI